MEDILVRVYFGNSLKAYLAVLGLCLGCLAALGLLRALLLRRMEKWAAATETTLDDLAVALLRQDLIPLLTAGCFFLPLHGLALPPPVARLLGLLWMAVLTFFGVRLILQVVVYTMRTRWDGPSGVALQAVLPVMKMAAWAMGLIFFLDNAGVKISAVVTGLGIGGVAVALAAQTVLGDLFSHVAILFDRPFVIGDFIVLDDLMGTVENIGIKTTRVRSLTGELVVMPNSAITSARLRNFQSLQRRRVSFTLGVAYETPMEELKRIPALVKEIVSATPGAAFDRAHFAAFAESSLDFEVVYFVASADYNPYMDVKEKINFAIKEAFEKRGIGFPYPTRTVYTIPAKT